MANEFISSPTFFNLMTYIAIFGFINYLFIAMNQNLIELIQDPVVRNLIYIIAGICIIMSITIAFGYVFGMSHDTNYIKQFLIIGFFSLPGINYLFMANGSSLIGRIDNYLIETLIYSMLGIFGVHGLVRQIEWEKNGPKVVKIEN